MAEHPLVDAMEEEVAAKIAEIDRQADQEIADIEARANHASQEAAEREKSRSEQLLLAYSREKRQLLENEWRIRIRNFQFEMAEQVFQQLQRVALSARERDDYPAIWSRLREEAMQVYGQERSDKPILKVAPEDEALARAHSLERDKVEIDAAVHDGVELESCDRRVLVKNTLASRLQRARDQFLKSISDAIQKRLQ